MSSVFFGSSFFFVSSALRYCARGPDYFVGALGELVEVHARQLGRIADVCVNTRNLHRFSV